MLQDYGNPVVAQAALILMTACTVAVDKGQVQDIWWQNEAEVIGQANQGQCMTWEGVEKRKISWEELWDIKAFRVSFTIKADFFWCVDACSTAAAR